MLQVVRATLGLFNVYEVNIAFPILLVNRKTDINIEKPILFYFYVLIGKRKPITGMGCLKLFVLVIRIALILVIHADLPRQGYQSSFLIQYKMVYVQFHTNPSSILIHQEIYSAFPALVQIVN